MQTPPTDPLALPLRELRGVGPERVVQLARLKLHVVQDLLMHLPRRHEDRRHYCKISELELGKAATTRGTVVAMGTKRFRGGRGSVFELILEDGSGRLHCRWWNLPFMQNYFAVGDEVFAYGKLSSLKPRTVDHPETEVLEAGEESTLHSNRIVPVYPLTEGVQQRWLRGLIRRTFDRFEDFIPEPWPPQTLGDVPTRGNALHMYHFPEELTDIAVARQRLALDEFLELQLTIQLRRRRLQANSRALPCAGDNHLIKPFLAQLGFTLTEAQTRVLREIRRDQGGRYPMRRLLQGDVGAGKTVVAACSALMALESGFSVALMAPTEILAEQHYRNFKRWLEPLNVTVELHTGSVKTAAKAQMYLGTQMTTQRTGTLHIGTHALIESGFVPENLGLVIIDEQHKFGVTQREALVKKGHYPHLLVMTATPIPRTLGLTLYGDLDSSIIDQLPYGRGKLKTFVRTPDKLPKVWEFIREQLTAGRQAYVVYPRIEDNEKDGVKAVTKEFEKLRKELTPHKVGLLHGRLKAEEKEAVMASFRANQTHVLVATSVIEVGVDVANATVMLIENAEQFGLAQLHQLRGRIGRGTHDSYCILVASVKTDEARERLYVLEQTNDGFQIAEADMKLRGPGELVGQQQSGLPTLRFGDLAEDRDLIERARKIATDLLNKGFSQKPRGTVKATD